MGQRFKSVGWIKKKDNTAILMHPAPVNWDVEIADHLVEAPNHVLLNRWRMEFVRMAIMVAALKGR